jgi:hypothetical protein
MRTYKEPNNHSGTRIRRGIGLLLTSCFFLGVVALAMHHHDVSFQLKSCAICKAKTSFSGTLNKVTADTPITMAILIHCLEDLYFTYSEMNDNHQTPFISSLLPNPFLNKAPPFIS